MTQEDQNNKKSLVDKFSSAFERWMPDSMTIAFILVIVAAVLAIVFTGAPIFQSTESQKSIADSMAENFWNLLAFSMQMVLITVLGNVFASSPPMKKLLRKFCSLPKSTVSAYIMCAMLGAVLSWFHWAIGWMGCIVIGKEMLLQAKQRGIRIHTPSFVAAIFCTALVGGSGISASQILYASTPGYLKSLVDEQTAALMPESYTVMDTAIYAQPLITVAVSCVLVLAVVMFMRPKKGSPIEEITPEQEAFYSIDVDTLHIDKSTPAKRLANSIVLQYIIVALMGYWCINMLMNGGFMGISINSYNYLVLTATLACCMRPRIFVELFVDTIQSAWAFVIQYPFYAGIFGIIVGTGFDKVIAGFFLSFATTGTWPSIAMLYSAFLNIFVPSAGSKFIIEAPYIIPVTFQLNCNVETILMSYGYGDCATNMLTPFWWVLPCGLFKIDYHKVLPYAVVGCLVVTAYYFIAMFFW